jgi:5-methylcytosine-specific restriction endonuclease McrA
MTARVKRGPGPPKVLTDSNYRKYALPALERDFQERCAYSMQHKRKAGGSSIVMEIDHFDPTIKGRDRHRYENLFLSTRHCNNKKQGNWPTDDEQARGIRLLNCCAEQDYGVHIFEDTSTHHLVGVTPQGRFHIEY